MKKVSATLILFATLLFTANAVQAQPLPPHRWSRIVYPDLAPLGTPLVPGIHVSNEADRGLRFDLVYGAPCKDQTALPRDADIEVRLHRLGARIITAPHDPNRGVGGAGNARSCSFPFIYFFPWQENVLEEAWIECRLPGQTYWIEIPYGFTRNPADPLTPVRILRGRPTLLAEMKSMDAADKVVPFAYVEYDLGEIQNKWRATVHIANPVDASADLVLYRNDRGGVGKSIYQWNLQTPVTAMSINDPGGRLLKGMPFGIRLHDDGLRRTDTFQFFRDPGPDERAWGTATVSVDDQSYSFTIPSSLFKFFHGTVESYPNRALNRVAPCIQNPFGSC